MYYFVNLQNKTVDIFPGTYIERKKVIENINIVNIRLYCAQIVGWVRASFDNIDDERRLFDGFVN